MLVLPNAKDRRWPTVLRVLSIVGDRNACSAWRIWQPFRALQQRGYPAEWTWKTDVLTPLVAQAFDVYVLPRIWWPTAEQYRAASWFATVRAAGRFVLYETDDDLFSEWVVPQQQQSVRPHATVAELEAERQARIWTLRQCDGVTVTTPRLATIVQQYTDAPVAVVPNALDARWFRAVQRMASPRRSIPPLTIGWQGGARPDADVAAMAVAWGRIARRFPHITFVVQGHQPRILHEQVPPERLRAIPWLPLEAYPLGLANTDIACCPLADAPFNRAKSSIKAYEAAASGSAVVASPTVYRQVVTPGETGLLAETADEWEASLVALVEDEALRRKLARRLWRTVEQQHTLEGQVERWPQAWQQLVTQAASLRGRGRRAPLALSLVPS